MASVKALMPGPGAPIGYVEGKPVTISGPWNTFFQQAHLRAGGNPYDKVDGTYQLTLGVQTDLNDATAGGLFTATAATTSSGAQATIALKVRAGGGEAFRDASILMSALAGTASRIEINATDVLINGIVLASGAIITGHLAANAATLPGYRAGSGTIPCAPANAWTLIDTFSDTFIGRPATLWPGIEFDNTDSAEHPYTVAITLNSTDPDTAPIYKPTGTLVAAKNPASTLFSFIVPSSPSAGSNTYRVYFKALDSNTNVRARFWNITYQENRR